MKVNFTETRIVRQIEYGDVIDVQWDDSEIEYITS